MPTQDWELLDVPGSKTAAGEGGGGGGLLESLASTAPPTAAEVGAASQAVPAASELLKLGADPRSKFRQGSINFTVNGKQCTVDSSSIDPRTMLARARPSDPHPPPPSPPPPPAH